MHVTFANSIVPFYNEMVEFQSTYQELNKRATPLMWDTFISPIMIQELNPNNYLRINNFVIFWTGHKSEMERLVAG